MAYNSQTGQLHNIINTQGVNTLNISQQATALAPQAGVSTSLK